MRTFLRRLAIVMVLLFPLAATAQEASLDQVAKAMGAAAVNPTPVALIDRQLQLWTTPHGVVKAAMVNKATVQGRAISFAVPGKYKVKATVDAQSMIERIDAVAPHAVLGDIPVEIRYSDYKDFGGVKFPTKIKQTIGAYPALELTVSDVQPNIAVDLAVH